jgi:hypothetical protein
MNAEFYLKNSKVRYQFDDMDVYDKIARERILEQLEWQA